MISSVSIKFSLLGKSLFFFCKVLKNGNMRSYLSTMENMIRCLTFRSFILHFNIIYIDFTYALWRLIKSISGWFFFWNYLMWSIKRMVDIMMVFSCSQFLCIWKWSLCYYLNTFSWRSRPNLSSTKLPISTPWRYLSTESMTDIVFCITDIIIYTILLK